MSSRYYAISKLWAAAAVAVLLPVLCFADHFVDLNGDSCTDRIRIVSDSLFVGLNDCSANFPFVTGYEAGAEPVALCTADLDNDGDIDIAVADSSTASVTVLLNGGDGIFAEAVEYPYSYSTGIDICPLDIDLDGDQDLALLLANKSVRILTNYGDGTFLGQQAFRCPGTADRIEAADIDGDGYPDVITESNVVAISFNTRSGEPRRPGHFYTGIRGQWLLADFNQDSYSDLVFFAGLHAEIIANNGSGKLTESNVLWSYGGCAEDCEFTGHVVTDLDEDGDPDLISAFYARDDAWFDPGRTGIRVRWNDGHGNMTHCDSCGTAEELRGKSYLDGCADFNGDGNLDLVIDQYQILYGSGDGRFQDLIPTSIADGNDASALPLGYSLSQNYPNPFNPSTTFEYSLPERSYVTIEVFNTLGQKVTTLVNGIRPAGSHTVTWNSNDSGDQPLASGVYFYRFLAGDHVETRKMVLLK